jgi:pyrophosphatase PpaX
MLKAILFDIGGTLVLTEDALLDAIIYSLQSNNVPTPTKQKLIEHIGRSNYNTMIESIPDNYPNREVVAEKCFSTFRKVFPRDFLCRFKEVDGVEAVLRDLRQRGHKLGIVTGFQRKEANPILNLFKWSVLFDLILTLEDYTNPRPAPDCVLTAASRLKVRSNECAYVADTVDDIRAGKAAEARTIVVLTGAQSKEMLEKENPDFIIESIRDLPNII